MVELLKKTTHDTAMFMVWFFAFDVIISIPIWAYVHFSHTASTIFVVIYFFAIAEFFFKLSEDTSPLF